MYINEMPSGSAVELYVKNKEGKELTLSTQVLGTYDSGDYKMVLVDAFRHNGQVLAFNSVICYATITNTEDGRAYKYKLHAVVKKEHEENVYHCLVSNEDATEENRRGAKRFGLSEKADIQVLGTKNVLKGYVHDISATGIAILAPETKIAIGDRVAIAFDHEITGAHLKVVAQVIRSEQRDKGTLFGCQVQKHDAKYTLLISYLMRQECRVKK